jgi:hypothetical protein
METADCETDDCPKPPPIRTTSPAINTFVLYAERSISLGDHDNVHGGDVGVHAIAQQTYGFQFSAGTGSIIDERYNVYSPTVSLGKDVKVGIMQTNTVDDDGVSLQSPVPYPGTTMPAPPLAPKLIQNNDAEAVTVVAKSLPFSLEITLRSQLMEHYFSILGATLVPALPSSTERDSLQLPVLSPLMSLGNSRPGGAFVSVLHSWSVCRLSRHFGL